MWIVLIVLAVLVVIVFIIYNSLIGKKNQVKNVFSTTDVLLRKRYDLIPQLVETVKGYMQHERTLLEQITKLRADATSGQYSDDELVAIDSKLNKALGSIMLAVENYPDLKAGENFMQLQRTMTELEEQISAARRAYNAAVTDYNNAVEMFPTSIVARAMGYKSRSWFEISGEQRENPDAGGMLNN